jgi:hypothetical protein
LSFTAGREVDDLPPPPVVDDAGEPLVVAAVEADLVDAHHLGEAEPRDGRVVGVEEPDRVGFVDPVPPRDGREGLVGEELPTDLGLRQVGDGGVARRPPDRRRERPPAGLAGEPHLEDERDVPDPPRRSFLFLSMGHKMPLFDCTPTLLLNFLIRWFLYF